MADIFIHKRASVNSITKKDASVFDVYVDGFRVGFVKFRNEAWHAHEWFNFRHLEKFPTQKEAIDRVVLNYTILRSHWSPEKIEKFESRAIRLKPGLTQEAYGNF